RPTQEARDRDGGFAVLFWPEEGYETTGNHGSKALLCAAGARACRGPIGLPLDAFLDPAPGTPLGLSVGHHGPSAARGSGQPPSRGWDFMRTLRILRSDLACPLANSLPPCWLQAPFATD